MTEQQIGGQTVDVAFSISGESLPLDHGYLLFSALSNKFPQLHREPSWAVHPVRGERALGDKLLLDKRSLLKVRLPVEAFPPLITLTNVKLDVGGQPIKLGVPRVFPLVSAAKLRARLVTIKNAGVSTREKEASAREELFLAVRKQLAQLPLEMDSKRIDVGVGARHVIRVGKGKGHLIIGFGVTLDGLSASASLVIQQHGIGGRRHMGCGVFVPLGRGVAQ